MGCLRAALGLWRGDPLVELADHLVGLAEAARLVELRRAGEDLLADGRLGLGEHAGLVGDLERAVAAEPLRERRWAQLMVALYRSGRQADALRAYQRLRSVLGDELGLEPSEETRALEAAILAHDRALDLPGTEPNARSLHSPSGAGPPQEPVKPSKPTAPSPFGGAPPELSNLPVWLSSFVGRHRETAEVERLVEGHRLVTVTGVGGAGKTRLAVAVAARLVATFAGGVWFVDLGPLPDADLVAGAVSTTVGIGQQAGRKPIELLVEVLADRTALIVMDSCEHLIASCAALAHVIHRRSRRVHVLTTSREPLGIDGEQVYRLPPLSLPPEGARNLEDLEGCDAVELLVQRARAHDSAFALDKSIAAAVGSLCRTLDGVPLAIELAAARLASMSVADLDHRLDQRFGLLTAGSRTALPRQQTLQATLDWSFDLLSPAEQTVVGRLSVFVGSFGLDAAEAVGATGHIETFEVVDLVASLVNKSLLVAERTLGSLRYRMLETVRQYAAARTADGDGPPAKQAHAAFYLTLAETAAPELTGPHQGAWLKRLDLEWDNLRSALAFVATQPDRTAEVLRFGVALQRFFITRELVDPLSDLLAAVDASNPAPAALRANALCAAAVLHRRLVATNVKAELVTTERLGEQALRIARHLDDPILLVKALSALAVVAGYMDQTNRALTLGEEALEIARQVGDLHLIGLALTARARSAPTLLEQRATHCQALACHRQAGDILYLSMALYTVAHLDSELDDLEAAGVHNQEAINLAQDIGAYWVLTRAWCNHGVNLVVLGRLHEAEQVARALLLSCRRVGRQGPSDAAIFVLACCATNARDHRRAAQLTGAHDVMDAKLTALGHHWTEREQSARDDNRDRLRRALGNDEFERALRCGANLSFDEAVDLALENRLQRSSTARPDSPRWGVVG